MSRICSFCGNKNFRHRRVQYIYKNNDKYLIVNNVPYEECEYGDEQYFAAGTLKRIEIDFNKIYVSGKKPKAEIQIPVEEFLELVGA